MLLLSLCQSGKMESKYFTINIQEYFATEELVSLLNDLIDSFECSINEEVETFLKNGAIESAKQGKAATYLVFMDSDNPSLVGYFTLAIKPITVHRKFINSKYAQKFERVCIFNDEEQTYHLSAYLIAQLGKIFLIQYQIKLRVPTYWRLQKVK